MDTTSKLLFGIGAVLALLVGVAVYLAVSAAQGFGPRATMTAVVVAQKEIPERTFFTAANLPDLLTTRQLPSDAVPPGALRSPADAVGKATLLPLLPGEVVIDAPDRLATAEGTGARPSATIPRDKVALAISASDSVSVAGALQPGDRVDVIASWTAPGEQLISQTVFPDVRVFSVGPWRGGSRGPVGLGSVAGAAAPAPSAAASTVTLLLDYQQAVVTQFLLQSGGHVALALRRFDQSGDVATEPVTAESLTRRALNDGRPFSAPATPQTAP